MLTRWLIGIWLAIALVALPVQPVFAHVAVAGTGSAALAQSSDPPVTPAQQTLQQGEPVATIESSGWATVVRVLGPESIRVRNDHGTSFTVWHIGVIGPHPGQGEWRTWSTIEHRGLLPAGARVWLEVEPGADSGAEGIVLRHVFTEDAPDTPVAARLLAAGSVWVFPDALHAYVGEFADRQAEAVLARAGAWGETESEDIFLPSGETHGGYPIDPQVRHVLEVLDSTELGHELLVEVNRFPVEIGVMPHQFDILGSFSRREYSIQLSDIVISASAESASAVLFHELVHVKQMLDQQLEGQEEGCLTREEEAFSAQAEYWESLHGPRGIARATHPLDENLNAVLRDYQDGTLAIWVHASYADICAD